ncbi:uncharacterized protein [Temnothorax longispinosus]|uniref:uncharacterized protein n=1 Tax=Temnothorax longispinosus TaxID=300112 RepID=UPI003A99D779
MDQRSNGGRSRRGERGLGGIGRRRSDRGINAELQLRCCASADIKSIFNEDLIGVGRIPRTVSELHTDDANKDIRAVTWDELDGPESEARDEFVLADAATTRACTAKRA